MANLRVPVDIAFTFWKPWERKKINLTVTNLGLGPETRLPKEFYDAKGRKIIEKIGVEEWFSGYQESQEYRSLGIGGLMGDLVQRMVGNVQGNKYGG